MLTLLSLCVLFLVLQSVCISGALEFDNIQCHDSDYGGIKLKCEIFGPLTENNPFWNICKGDIRFNEIHFISNWTEQQIIPDDFLSSCDSFKSLSFEKMFVNLNTLKIPLAITSLRLDSVSAEGAFGVQPELLQHGHLRKLELQMINLTELSSNPFNYFNNLRELTMVGCEISLEDDYFFNLDHLQSCSISSSNVLHLTRRAFAGLIELKKLSLVNNKIEKLHDYGFQYLVDLKSLNLLSNSIEDINREIFFNLEKLKFLSIGSNKIKYLPDFTFEHLKSLKHLDLERNFIKEITPAAFEGLGKVKKLLLTENKIQHLSIDVFRKLNSLEFLSLIGNDIKYFSKYPEIEYFKKLQRGKAELLMVLNPLRCSCNNRWITRSNQYIECYDENNKKWDFTIWAKLSVQSCFSASRHRQAHKKTPTTPSE